MTIQSIVYMPDARLRAPTEAITAFGPDLQQLIDDMFETMYSVKGIGLAAPQIGVSKRLAVIDITGDASSTLCLINPEIADRRGETPMREACLSIPGIYEEVPRALWVKLSALDRHGQSYELEAEGLLAHCIQHEVDHLCGRLFVDYLSPLKRQLIRKKLEKIKRKQG